MPRLYNIQQGDNLTAIAQREKTTIPEILKLNPNVTDPNLIQAGADLNLPDIPGTEQPITPATLPNQQTPPVTPSTPITPPPPPVVPPTTMPSLLEGSTYTVQPGETLSGIAKKLGVPVTSVGGYRSGNPDVIFPGENLQVRGTQPQQPEQSQEMPEKQSDTLDTDSNRFNLEDEEESSPVDFIKTYTSVLEELGISSIKSQFDKVQKEFDELQNQLNNEIADVNDNPWLSESARSRKVNALTNKYEGRLSIKTNQLKLYDSLYQEGIAQAKYLATGEVAQQQWAFEQAQKAYEAEQKIKEEVASGKYKNIKEVNGGLYDLDTNIWITPPKAEGSGQTIKSGGLVIPESAISVGQKKLDQSRGMDDKFANTDLYLQMLSAWKKDGGLEQDFFTNYPPKNYLNPNEGEGSKMPKYIKDMLKVSDDATPSWVNG